MSRFPDYASLHPGYGLRFPVTAASVTASQLKIITDPPVGAA